MTVSEEKKKKKWLDIKVDAKKKRITDRKKNKETSGGQGQGF